MTHRSIDKKWEKRQKIPSGNGYSMPLAINEQEFIMLSISNHGRRRILKHNIHQNQWKVIMKSHHFPLMFGLNCTTMAFDKLSNKLYIKTKQKGINIVIIDLQTQTIKTQIFPNWKEKKLLEWYGFMLINDNIHIIGGKNNAKHLLWNVNHQYQNKLRNIWTFFEPFYYVSTIHVPSRDIVLLIGGISASNKQIGIMMFDLITNKWQRVSGLKCNLFHASTVLTSNEDFVIIAGGYYRNILGSKVTNDRIYILDMRNDEWKLRESKVRLPIGGRNHLMRIGGIKDECLVVGWIKRLFKLRGFRKLLLPPMYIIQLIVDRYGREEIHWIQRCDSDVVTDSNHYSIDLRYLLSTL